MRVTIALAFLCFLDNNECFGVEPADVVAGYVQWLADTQDVTLTAKITRSFEGDTKSPGVVTSRHEVRLSRDAESLDVADELEVIAEGGGPKSKQAVDMKVSAKGAVVVPRARDGKVASNVIAEPSVTLRTPHSAYIPGNLAYLFGYLEPPKPFTPAFFNGSIVVDSKLPGRRLLEVFKADQTGVYRLQVDLDRGGLPTRYERSVDADDLWAPDTTLRDSPPPRSPYLPKESRIKFTNRVECLEATPAAPFRITKLKHTQTSVFKSGKSASMVTIAELTYPPNQRVAVVVPNGTRAVITRDESGVEYLWKDDKAVPAVDEGFAGRLKRVVFKSGWAGKAAAAALVGLAALVIYRFRHRLKAKRG